jgi:hypothetical protein
VRPDTVGRVTAGSPTAMTRVVDGPRAAALAAALLPGLPDAAGPRIAVVLEDLAGDDGHPLGVAVIDLPSGRAGVLAGLTDASQAVTGRLLRVGADHLRVLGRLRLTASCATGSPGLSACTAAGFRRAREESGRVDLVLEL